jgi:hypothetical protein
MKLMVKHDMVIGPPRFDPLDSVCEGCVLGKHHQAMFETMKA